MDSWTCLLVLRLWHGCPSNPCRGCGDMARREGLWSLQGRWDTPVDSPVCLVAYWPCFFWFGWMIDLFREMDCSCKVNLQTKWVFQFKPFACGNVILRMEDQMQVYRVFHGMPEGRQILCVDVVACCSTLSCFSWGTTQGPPRPQPGDRGMDYLCIPSKLQTANMYAVSRGLSPCYPCCRL